LAIDQRLRVVLGQPARASGGGLGLRLVDLGDQAALLGISRISSSDSRHFRLSTATPGWLCFVITTRAVLVLDPVDHLGEATRGIGKREALQGSHGQKHGPERGLCAPAPRWSPRPSRSRRARNLAYALQPLCLALIGFMADSRPIAEEALSLDRGMVELAGMGGQQHRWITGRHGSDRNGERRRGTKGC
jgi:hypothetical protein